MSDETFSIDVSKTKPSTVVWLYRISSLCFGVEVEPPSITDMLYNGGDFRFSVRVFLLFWEIGISRARWLAVDRFRGAPVDANFGD